MSRTPGHRADLARRLAAADPATGAFAFRKARFLAVVSHELRTPLTSIASFTDSLASDDMAPADRPMALDAVRRNTTRMLALVEDLMLLSRLETGDLPLAATPVDVPAIMREAADTLAAAEPGTGVDVTTAGGPAVYGDAGLLRQAVYAAAGTVTSQAADRRARLSATTDPAGWTITALARQAEKLTEEHLLAGTLPVPEPAGRRRSVALWMLLADAIAERHGGNLSIDFDPAHGAAITVRVPVSAAPGG